MLSISFGAKMPTLYSCQNSLPIGQKDIFQQTLPFFFFFFFYYLYRIIHVYLRSLNILPTCFQAKMATLHIGRNSWLVGTSGIFIQNLQDLFFFQKNFPFYSWTTKYAIYKFWCENTNIVFRSKFFTSRTKVHFRTNFARVFIIILFYFIVIEFSTSFWVLWIYYLHVFVGKWRRCIPVEIPNQSKLRAFLYKIYPNFFPFRKNFPFSFRTTKYAICRFWSKNEEIAFWSKFLTSRN